jgi:hypothetical protein
VLGREAFLQYSQGLSKAQEMARRLLLYSVQVQTMKPKTHESNVPVSQKENTPVKENPIDAGHVTKDLESAPKSEAVVQAIWGRWRNGHVLCQK